MSYFASVLGRSTSSSSDELPSSPTSPTSPSDQRSPKIQQRNVWQGVFNPGRNYSRVSQTKMIDKIDHVNNEDTSAKTMWQQILKSQNLSRLSAGGTFESLDRDGDGYLGVDDLKAHFGKSVDVHRLIDAADKNKNGRISLDEFKAVMRNS